MLVGEYFVKKKLPEIKVLRARIFAHFVPEIRSTHKQPSQEAKHDPDIFELELNIAVVNIPGALNEETVLNVISTPGLGLNKKNYFL